MPANGRWDLNRHLKGSIANDLLLASQRPIILQETTWNPSDYSRFLQAGQWGCCCFWLCCAEGWSYAAFAWDGNKRTYSPVLLRAKRRAENNGGGKIWTSHSSNPIWWKCAKARNTECKKSSAIKRQKWEVNIIFSTYELTLKAAN